MQPREDDLELAEDFPYKQACPNRPEPSQDDKGKSGILLHTSMARVLEMIGAAVNSALHTLKYHSYRAFEHC